MNLFQPFYEVCVQIKRLVGLLIGLVLRHVNPLGHFMSKMFLFLNFMKPSIAFNVYLKTNALFNEELILYDIFHSFLFLPVS